MAGGVLVGVLAGLVLPLIPMILVGPGSGVVVGVGAVIAVAVWFVVRAARRPSRRTLFFSAAGGMLLGALASPIALFVLVSYTGEGRDLPACECPTLVGLVESIDWAPGVTGRQRNASASDDQTRRGVSYQFDVDDASSHVARLRLIFERGGWEIEPYRETAGERGFTVGKPGYSVFVHEGGIFLPRAEEAFSVSVSLVDGVPDEQAGAVLQPVVEAVGLR